MPKREIRVIVASPGDVQAERDLMPRVIDELNAGIADLRGVRLDLARWETDTHPGFHPLGPQGLVDDMLHIEDCDVLIGLFWKRFGTPTPDSGSGTEHEIRRALAAWKKSGDKPTIMVYFKQKPANPDSGEEMDQWKKVIEFKKNLSKEGILWQYKSKNEFEGLIRKHLTKYIRGLPEPASSQAAQAAAMRTTPVPMTATPSRADPGTEDQLRRMHARTIALGRRLEDLKDRRNRGYLDEGRYAELATDLEQERIAVELEMQRLSGNRQGG